MDGAKHRENYKSHWQEVSDIFSERPFEFFQEEDKDQEDD
jgi:hypothetical protein